MFELKIVRERRPEYGPRTRIRVAQDVYDVFRSRSETADREVFLVLPLDGKNQVLGFHVVSVGTLTAALVHPREVFKLAILANAAAIILVHNHPSGDPTPSDEDRAITDRLRQAGDLIGIRVLDHVILGDGRFVSMAETGQW
jgi:DNA repair protein RadC